MVHKPYTIRGDIFIKFFPDKMEIHNPGLFPLGVTSANILHQSRRRNDNLARVFYALNLIEREGRGYDEIYEDLLSNGKPLPIAEEGNDRVTITIAKRIVSNEVVKLMDRASKEFQLKPKEVICLGIIAQNQTVLATELAKILDLKKPNALRDWLGSLDDYELIHTKGKTKGTEYFVNPEFLKKLDYKGKINLKNIEPLRLRELLIKVINDYGPCKMSGIRERIGKEIPVRKIRQQLDKLIKEDTIQKSGIKKGTEYFMYKNL